MASMQHNNLFSPGRCGAKGPPRRYPHSRHNFEILVASAAILPAYDPGNASKNLPGNLTSRLLHSIPLPGQLGLPTDATCLLSSQRGRRSSRR